MNYESDRAAHTLDFIIVYWFCGDGKSTDTAGTLSFQLHTALRRRWIHRRECVAVSLCRLGVTEGTDYFVVLHDGVLVRDITRSKSCVLNGASTPGTARSPFYFCIGLTG